jgi:hypothetical protein
MNEEILTQETTEIEVTEAQPTAEIKPLPKRLQPMGATANRQPRKQPPKHHRKPSPAKKWKRLLTTI